MGVLQAGAGLLTQAGAMGMSAISSVTGAASPGASSDPRQDRLVAYLTTLATYPYMYLQLTAAAAAEGLRPAGDATGRQLQDLPEGWALLGLERWCRLEPYTSLHQQLALMGAHWLRQQALTNLNHPRARQLLNHPRLLAALHMPAAPPIAAALHSAEVRAAGRLEASRGAALPQEVVAPVVLVDEVAAALVGPVAAIKAALEGRYVLGRGGTLLEHAQVLVTTAKWLVALWFTALRGLARAMAYAANLAGVVGAALTFTVVAAVVLSIVSTLLGLAQVSLLAFADFTEPLVMRVLGWCEAGTYKAADLGQGSLIGPRRLPASSVEELEPFFLQQLAASTTLLSRPEVPGLADQALLVRAYDCGLVDATGAVQTQVVLQWLRDSAVGAGPFRPDGFFGYASQRTVKAGIVLLCRLLSWQRLVSLVTRHEALSFVVIAGGPQSGKSTLFTRLVGAPEQYTATLGGTSAVGAGGGGVQAVGGDAGAPVAVDIRGIKGLGSTHAVVFPGLASDDKVLADVSSKLAAKVTGMSSCVVYLVTPDPQAPVHPADLRFVLSAAAAGRPVLVAINGPPRGGTMGRSAVFANTSASSGTAGAGGGGGGGTNGGQAGGARLTQQQQAEVVRAWRSALDRECRAAGVDHARVAVLVTDLLQEGHRGDATGMGGVAGYEEVRDWVFRSVPTTPRTA